MSDGAIGDHGGRLRSEPVVVFRTWRVDEGGWLHSPYVRFRWLTDRAVAQCVPGQVPSDDRAQGLGRAKGWLYDKARGHTPPVHDCACGLYGYYDPETVPERIYVGPQLLGAAVCTGRIQAHKEGLRAERMRILCLVPAKEIDGAAVSARYGVSLVHREGLMSYAREFGRILPDELRGV
jgi:hypothetical protein